MEAFSALQAICAWNSPVTSEFPSQKPVTRSFDFIFDPHLNKRMSKQWRRRWFETPSCSLLRYCNGTIALHVIGSNLFLVGLSNYQLILFLCATCIVCMDNWYECVWVFDYTPETNYPGHDIEICLWNYFLLFIGYMVCKSSKTIWPKYIKTHSGRDKMAVIFQTTFSNAFSWMNMYAVRLQFHRSLSLRVQLNISHHLFR